MPPRAPAHPRRCSGATTGVDPPATGWGPRRRDQGQCRGADLGSRSRPRCTTAGRARGHSARTGSHPGRAPPRCPHARRRRPPARCSCRQRRPARRDLPIDLAERTQDTGRCRAAPPPLVPQEAHQAPEGRKVHQDHRLAPLDHTGPPQPPHAGRAHLRMCTANSPPGSSSTPRISTSPRPAINPQTRVGFSSTGGLLGIGVCLPRFWRPPPRPSRTQFPLISEEPQYPWLLSKVTIQIHTTSVSVASVMPEAIGHPSKRDRRSRPPRCPGLRAVRTRGHLSPPCLFPSP